MPTLGVQPTIIVGPNIKLLICQMSIILVWKTGTYLHGLFILKI